MAHMSHLHEERIITNCTIHNCQLQQRQIRPCAHQKPVVATDRGELRKCTGTHCAVKVQGRTIELLLKEASCQVNKQQCSQVANEVCQAQSLV